MSDAPTSVPATARRALVWDAPNLDMTLAGILQAKPAPSQRPDFDAVGRWLVATAAEGLAVEATVFINVREGMEARLTSWTAWLTSVGFGVFAKPKHDDSDIDEDMVAHVRDLHERGELADLVVASHDARRWTAVLEALAAEGVHVSVLGFPEMAGGLAQSDAIAVVDLESVPGAITERLPRLVLSDLPAAGRYFAPRGTLGATHR